MTLTAEPTTTEPAPAGSRPRRPRSRADTAAPYVLLVPAAALFVCFFLIPLGYAVYLSLRGPRVTPSANGFGMIHTRFVGLLNYSRAFQDHIWLASFQRLLIYAVITIPLTLGGALLFALLLDAARARLVRFTRLCLLLPYAVPGVIAGIMWGFLYLPDTSPATSAASGIGWHHLNLLSPTMLYSSLANIAVWGALGFNMIILFTGLRATPAEVYDSARIDGCGEIRLAWRIKIPLIAPSLTLAGLFSLIGTLQAYSEPTVLAPLTTSISSTYFPMMNVQRDAFATNQPNLASAMAMIIALGTMIVSAVVLRFGRRAGAEES
ncbi:carbohydrate ABC transporter permease [Streptomyces sp. CA-111067]|uniref:carbohydrate ABC transporter permease n=1 Tax=Streptomyces sp. CA-111067 TaxID=3240046 RepID=UPI003D993D80